MVALDKDLMGTRSEDNPVKMLSTRKAYRKGQSADVVADEIFRCKVLARPHRRKDSNVDHV